MFTRRLKDMEKNKFELCSQCGAKQSENQPQPSLHCYTVEYECGLELVFEFGSDEPTIQQMCPMEMTDIEYLQKRIFESFRIPKEYLGGKEDGDN
jgi:hypothetical protein